MPAEIVVLGSLNMDLVVKAERAPEPGETLAANGYWAVPGGKGANQAVAIAKAGGRVAMAGRVGSDDHGLSLKSNLEKYGVDTAHVVFAPDSPTGTALIIVERSGENRILLVAGANGDMTEGDVDAAGGLIAHARALVLQMEIPWRATQRALELAALWRVPTILNLAPAYQIPDEALRKVDYLILNESELSLLTQIDVSDIACAKQAMTLLLDRGVHVAILTLGSRGALLATSSGIEYFPPYAVDAVDTTGAGDAFVGNFVASLVRTDDLAESMRRANAAGALAITRFGAQDSLPFLTEVEGLLQTRTAF